MANLTQYPEDPKTFRLNRISVPPFSSEGQPQRGKGLAREIMALLLADADRDGITIELFIVPSGDMSYRQLMHWYERLGFRVHPDFKHLWVRQPKAQSLNCLTCGAQGSNPCKTKDGRRRHDHVARGPRCVTLTQNEVVGTVSA